MAATFDTETLKPKRLTGRYEYTHEQAAQVPDLEMALRRDLGDAVKAKMSDLALNGDEATNAQEPSGFYEKITAPTAPSAVATYEDFAGSHALAVDGIHAQNEMEVSSVIGVASYQLAAKTFRTGAGSDEAASEALKRRSQMCVASSYVPAPASMIQTGNIFHAAGRTAAEPRCVVIASRRFGRRSKSSGISTRRQAKASFSRGSPCGISRPLSEAPHMSAFPSRSRKRARNDD